jgi:DNA topoisomerase I
VRHGRGFSYRTADGDPIRDPGVLRRLRALAVPPAWSDVWICPSPNGHLQATGRDARGRKQYRYHPAFRSHRDDDKYARTERFARALPRIRRRVKRDLAGRTLSRELVLAATVRLLERTLIRVGNDEYARDNRSYGVATLRDRHAAVDGSEVRLRFRGKAGRTHELSFRDRRLASIVRRCRDLPGQDLFQYVDDEGELRDVRSDDINAYIREAAGSDEFSAKDFRTWAGTVLAFRALAATGQAMDQAAPVPKALARSVRAAIEATAEQLGNTPAVARQAYVHPAVIEAYLEHGVRDAVLAAADVNPAMPLPPTPQEERAVLRLLATQAARVPTPRRRTSRARPGRAAR